MQEAAQAAAKDAQPVVAWAQHFEYPGLGEVPACSSSPLALQHTQSPSCCAARHHAVLHAAASNPPTQLHCTISFSQRHDIKSELHCFLCVGLRSSACLLPACLPAGESYQLSFDPYQAQLTEDAGAAMLDREAIAATPGVQVGRWAAVVLLLLWV